MWGAASPRRARTQLPSATSLEPHGEWARQHRRPCSPRSHLLHAGHPGPRGRLPDRRRPAEHLHGNRPTVSGPAPCADTDVATLSTQEDAVPTGQVCGAGGGSCAPAGLGGLAEQVGEGGGGWAAARSHTRPDHPEALCRTQSGFSHTEQPAGRPGPSCVLARTSRPGAGATGLAAPAPRGPPSKDARSPTSSVPLGSSAETPGTSSSSAPRRAEGLPDLGKAPYSLHRPALTPETRQVAESAGRRVGRGRAPPHAPPPSGTPGSPGGLTL